ncbi:hypothetical protein Y1Q_0018383 [Alligator mississippiensis]|uniref:Uncharacterized protein n=1 Tax=Alligator mississippiensis TaxID=8496 RepID=A0A151PC47_ALLMI|nr:hypothetical protein Y1Q_0018383 [Alligator mississippiensis]
MTLVDNRWPQQAVAQDKNHLLLAFDYWASCLVVTILSGMQLSLIPLPRKQTFSLKARDNLLSLRLYSGKKKESYSTYIYKVLTQARTSHSCQDLILILPSLTD